ncbi:MAG: hypothetical protein M1813_006547 [Trichoglossum hirsutum]|nr:MAG: hypothetical protein M1813_006547 [Trichoglossum hirsutum]
MTSAASKVVFLSYIDHQLTRERGGRRVRRANKLANEALIEDISKRKSETTSEEPNPEFEVLNCKKRLSSRLLPSGLDDYPTKTRRYRQSALPRSIRPTSLQGKQDGSEVSLNQREKHSGESREGIRMQRISPEQDRQIQLGKSPPALLGLSDDRVQIPRNEPLSTQTTIIDPTKHSWVGVASWDAIDGDVPNSGEIHPGLAHAPSRDIQENSTMIQWRNRTRDFLPRLHTILEVSSVSTPQRPKSAGRDNGGPLGTDQPWSGDATSLDLPLPCDTPNQKQNITPLDKAIGRSEALYSHPRERCFQMDGSRESKRIRTFNWIQGLPESGGVTLNTRGPGKISLVPHRLHGVADTSLPGVEGSSSESPRTPTAELKPIKECLPLEESRDPTGSISSQRGGGCDPVIGRSCVHSKRELSAGGLSSTNRWSTIRRSATQWNLSGPISRVELSPGIPIGARPRVSRRVIWARATVARETRERDQWLQRRAKMGWD